LLTVKQVAEVLGVCRATIYTLCDEGALAHVRVRNSIRISEATLATFVISGSCDAALEPRPY
jgi:excisionase family DNA binding protein